MPDRNHDALKLQAEAALKRLEEARLHERCPKACKSCSQKHRKCQFKNGHYPKCDLCAKNNRECEIIPTPVSHTRRSDETAYSASQQHYPGNYGHPSGPTQTPLGRTHRVPGQFAGGSPSGSPVEIRHSSATPPASYGYSQSDVYPYHSTPSQLSPSGHNATYSSPHNQEGQYAHYPSGHGHTQNHGSNSSAQHNRDPTTYYVPSQNDSSPSTSSFTPGPTHWSETHGPQSHNTQTAMSTGYGYSGSTHPSPPVRHGSASAVPQIHTTGQSYIRTPPGYQLASPTSPNSPYGVTGSSIYHIPTQNTSSVRYGTGSGVHGYDQGLNSSSPGSVNESGMYYHSGIPHQT